jgi:hypothetical protein
MTLITRSTVICFLAILILSVSLARAGEETVIAQHSSTGYRPGGTCQVTCEFVYPTNKSLSSLVWLVSLPEGWQITSATGSGTPEAEGNEIVFLANPLTNPIQFSYTASVPPSETGAKFLSSGADYTLYGMTNPAVVSVTPNPLSLSQQLQLVVTSAHGGTIPSAGTNTYNSTTNIAAVITNSPVISGETRYVCTGWTGTGSVSSGLGTNAEVLLTNDSTIIWSWKTQHELVLSNFVGGSVTDASGWYDSGTTATVSATASPHYQFTGWTGQTNGCMLSGDQIGIPMDGPRHITARFMLDSHTLRVITPYGNTQPADGIDSYEYGTVVPCSVMNSPVTIDTTQHVCTGWTGTGSVTLGTGTNTEVTITTNSTLTWLWKTQYWFSATSTTGGTVVASDGWYDLGESAQTVATASPHYHFVGWSGQTNGCQFDGTSISVPMNGTRHVQAHFELNSQTLFVTSAQGGTIPPEGANSFTYGNTVECTVTNSPLIDGLYRHVCTGWVGSGSISAGASTNAQIVLTNDSAITWLWKTQCLLTASGSVGGAVTDVSGWYDQTCSATVTAVAATNYHFTAWQGDTNACMIEEDIIIAPMDGPRSITATFSLNSHLLEVISPFGNTYPVVGSNYYDYGTSIPCSVSNSPVQDNATRYVCTGWTGWGSVIPGTGTNAQVTLTNDSGIAWLWKTQFWMTATATTGGTVSITNGWYDQGNSVTIIASTNAHYHFEGWSGQTNGCLITSNQIALLMDMPRNVSATFDLDQHKLIVNSKYGTATPPVGTNSLPYGTNLVCALINSPIDNITTQYICTGWSGTGSVPSSGTQTNTAQIMLTNNSTITWKWATNMWLNLAAGSGGYIKTNSKSGWFTAGSTVSNIEATASNSFHFTSWSGDTNGCTITSNKVNAPMSAPRSLTANFDIDTYRIVVSSKFGTPIPPVGTNLFISGSNTYCAIPDSPVMSGATQQYVCTGWTALGSIPTNGTTTNTGSFAITNHSSITWKWGTNYWFNLSTTEGGMLDRTSAWYSAGASISNMTATASNHYHFGSWTGDTNGCSISSNRLTLTMTRPRQIGASFVLDTHKLIVRTPYGTASPALGTNLYGYGSAVSCAIQDSPVTAGRTRYACTGWAGGGSVASTGSGTNTGLFDLNMDSTINWSWKTQYLFNVSCDEGGSTQGSSGWQDSGNIVTASVTTTTGFIFDQWQGDVPGGMETNNPLILTMDQARTINARIYVDTNLIRATHSATSYRSPETGRTVTCSFEYPAERTLNSLAWLVTLPMGWQITSVAGVGSPEVQGDEIVFLGSLKTNMIDFSYTLSIPGNAATTNNITAIADFQFDGMANSVGLSASPTPLTLSRYHSADYTSNYWVISGTEVSRFLSFWRTGGYQVNASGVDGFMPGAGNTNGGYHSADYLAPKWVISGTEVNRVLAYWRAGGYHVDPAGNDGYVAGYIAPKMGMSVQGVMTIDAIQEGPSSFEPGQTITISNTCTYSGTLFSLGCRPNLPRGWTILAASGDESPEHDQSYIVWSGKIPSSPVHFVYIVAISSNEFKSRTLSSEIEYQLSGMLNPSIAIPSPTIITLDICDQDNDGMPDTWENSYGGGATNMLPDADDDKDGMFNWQECIAGTNPNDSNSVLKVTGNVNVSEEQYVVSWASATNRWYTLGRTFTLSDVFTAVATNLPSTPPINCYTDTVSSVTSLFFRVEVEP